MAQTIRDLFGQAKDRWVFVVGTGTSLHGFDFRLLEGQITIGLNNAIFSYPHTYHLWHDPQLIKRYRDHPYAPTTAIVCLYKPARQLRAWPRFIRPERVYSYTQFTRKIALESDEMWCNHTVSATAIVLARKLGAHGVYLLGCDGYKVSGTVYHDGAVDVNGVRERMLERSLDTQDHDEVREWLTTVGHFHGGVWNVNPFSELSTWPYLDIAETLPGATLCLPERTVRKLFSDQKLKDNTRRFSSPNDISG